MSAQMSRQEIVALCERRAAALSRLDVEALTADYAEGCLVESPTAGGVVKGRVAVREIFQRVTTAFQDLEVQTVNVMVDGNRAVHVMDTRGTDIGGFLGFPPTGKPFRISVVFLSQFRGRQIVRELRVYDFTAMLIQVGHLKAKPA
jgi:steroid delta-isomerase-like uncharacterized protein